MMYEERDKTCKLQSMLPIIDDSGRIFETHPKQITTENMVAIMVVGTISEIETS